MLPDLDDDNRNDARQTATFAVRPIWLAARFLDTTRIAHIDVVMSVLSIPIPWLQL